MILFFIIIAAIFTLWKFIISDYGTNEPKIPRTEVLTKED